jgi:hypothetical protein
MENDLTNESSDQITNIKSGQALLNAWNSCRKELDN